MQVERFGPFVLVIGLLLTSYGQPVYAQRSGLPSADQIDGVMKACAVGRSQAVQGDIEGRIQLWRQGAEANGKASLDDLGAILNRVPQNQQISPEIYATYTKCITDLMGKLINAYPNLGDYIPRQPVYVGVIQSIKGIGRDPASYQTDVMLINQSQQDIDLNSLSVNLFDAQDNVIKINSDDLSSLSFLAPSYPSSLHINTNVNVKTIFVCMSGIEEANASPKMLNANGDSAQSSTSFSLKFTYIFPEAITPENAASQPQRVKSLPKALQAYETVCGT